MSNVARLASMIVETYSLSQKELETRPAYGNMQTANSVTIEGKTIPVVSINNNIYFKENAQVVVFRNREGSSGFIA